MYVYACIYIHINICNMKYSDKDNLQQLDFVSITLYIYIYKKKNFFRREVLKNYLLIILIISFQVIL